jgi:hypothetical protein
MPMSASVDEFGYVKLDARGSELMFQIMAEEKRGRP